MIGTATIQNQLVEKIVELSESGVSLRSKVVEAKLELDRVEALVELEINSDKNWLQDNAELMGLDSIQPLLSNSELRKNALVIARTSLPMLSPFYSKWRSLATKLETVQTSLSNLQMIFDHLNRIGVSELSPKLSEYIQNQLRNNHD